MDRPVTQLRPRGIIPPPMSTTLRNLHTALPVFLLLFATWPLLGNEAEQTPWRSELYPETWTPSGPQKFETDKLVQDFSYAGYHRGETPLPTRSEPLRDVTEFGADPSGKSDSTKAIQSAIDAVAEAGGGVVFLPEGTFRIAPPEDAPCALKIDRPNVVLRGAGADKTFLLNTSAEMRAKSILLVEGGSVRWEDMPAQGPATLIREDLLSPTSIIPVESVEGFRTGDWVILRTDATEEFIAEHNMADKWGGWGHRLRGVRFHRQILSIDPEKKEITVDVPIRYYLKTRDNARVYAAGPHIEEVGLENFSIGNIEHPKSREMEGWGLMDFLNPGTGGYDVHSSAAITFRRARNCWVSNVETRKPDENTTSAHILSNGIVLEECRGITIADCSFQHTLYGGGGGNGYMVRLSNSNECLIVDTTVGYNRHGMVVSGMAASGNVFLRGAAKMTQKQAAGNGIAGSKGSDHHMQLSQSNLIDGVLLDGDFFDARYRTGGDAQKGNRVHGQTAVHTVYWNLKGESYHSTEPFIVRSDQARYGYIIGTRGKVSEVSTSGAQPQRTVPVDHVEGVGLGDSLEPESLYVNQLQRRLQSAPQTVPKN